MGRFSFSLASFSPFSPPSPRGRVPSSFQNALCRPPHPSYTGWGAHSAGTADGSKLGGHGPPGVPGCWWGRLGHKPGQQDCHPLLHWREPALSSLESMGPSGPIRLMPASKGPAGGPRAEVQVEASVHMQGDACELVQGSSNCWCSQEVGPGLEAVIYLVRGPSQPR